MVVFDELNITPDGKKLIVEAHVNTMDYFVDQRIEGIYINTDDSFSENGFNKDACVAFHKFKETSSAYISVYQDNSHKFDVVNPTLYNNKELTIVADADLDLLSDKEQNRYTISDVTVGKIAIENVRFSGSKYWLAVDNTEGLEAGKCYAVITPTMDTYSRKVRWEFSINDFLIGHNDLSHNLFFVYIKTVGNPKPCTPCGEDGEYTLGVTFNTTLLYQKALEYIRELNEECAIPRGFIDFILQFEMLKSAIETGHMVVAVKFFNKLFKETSTKTSKCGCYGRYNL